jgi:hypothetical protein
MLAKKFRAHLTSTIIPMQKDPETTKRAIGVGTALGTSLGVVFGVALRNIALGIGIGAALGTALGVAFAHKKKNG